MKSRLTAVILAAALLAGCNEVASKTRQAARPPCRRPA